MPCFPSLYSLFISAKLFCDSIDFLSGASLNHLFNNNHVPFYFYHLAVIETDNRSHGNWIKPCLSIFYFQYGKSALRVTGNAYEVELINTHPLQGKYGKNIYCFFCFFLQGDILIYKGLEGVRFTDGIIMVICRGRRRRLFIARGYRKSPSTQSAGNQQNQ